MSYARKLAAFLILAATTAAIACDVPVFEYALENWPADSYTLVVFPGGKLSDQDSATLDWLKKTCETDAGTPNLSLRVVEKLDDNDPAMRTLWEKVCGSSASTTSSPAGPKAALVAPAGRGLLWSGGLTRAACEAIIDSPARKELSRRLLSGHACVWVLLESGKKQLDDAAGALLKAKLAEASQSLQATVPISPKEVESPSAAPATKNVEFSFMRVSAKDPQEQMFIKMLMAADHDAADGPMAFSVFGRGRALYGFAGKNLSPDNILGVCEFVISDCSCEVKNQNPGVDMLMWTDWENRFSAGATAGGDRPVTGLTALAEPLASSPADAGASEAGSSGSSWPIVRNVLLAVAGLAVVGGLLALAARKKASRVP